MSASPTIAVTSDGLSWMHERLVNESTPPITTIALGSGSSAPAAADTSLDAEVVRRDVSSDNAQLFFNSEVPEIRFRITIQGGTDVPAGTEISELGVFNAAGTLIYRETRVPIEMNQGIRRTIDSRLTLTSE